MTALRLLACRLSAFIQSWFDPTLPLDVRVDGHVYERSRYEIRGDREYEIAWCVRGHWVEVGWRQIGGFE
jgi:hypothetical protein